VVVISVVLADAVLVGVVDLGCNSSDKDDEGIVSPSSPRQFVELLQQHKVCNPTVSSVTRMHDNGCNMVT